MTHLDIVRASTFVATVVGKAEDAPKYTIPVIGGHAGATILPLLTQSEPKIVSPLIDRADFSLPRFSPTSPSVTRSLTASNSAVTKLSRPKMVQDLPPSLWLKVSIWLD